MQIGVLLGGLLSNMVWIYHNSQLSMPGGAIQGHSHWPIHRGLHGARDTSRHTSHTSHITHGICIRLDVEQLKLPPPLGPNQSRTLPSRVTVSASTWVAIFVYCNSYTTDNGPWAGRFPLHTTAERYTPVLSAETPSLNSQTA